MRYLNIMGESSQFIPGLMLPNSSKILCLGEVWFFILIASYP